MEPVWPRFEPTISLPMEARKRHLTRRYFPFSLQQFKQTMVQQEGAEYNRPPGGAAVEVWIRQSMAYHPHVDGPMPFPVPGWMWDGDLGHELYSQRMPYIRRMDELGFDGIIFTEHHYGP